MHGSKSSYKGVKRGYAKVSLKRFLLINLGESRWIAGLEQALDLSKNVLDQAKRDLGNSLLRPDPNFLCTILILQSGIKSLHDFINGHNHFFIGKNLYFFSKKT